jgi:5'-nucleotidase
MKQEGVNKIVVLSHLGLNKDTQLAATVSDIDVIVGGHSHTLLGDWTAIGLETAPYPIVVKDPNGSTVCVVHAWAYGRVLGALDVEFDEEGHVQNCDGTATLILGGTFTFKNANGDNVPVDEPTQQLINEVITNSPNLEIVGEDPEALAILDKYRQEIDVYMQTVIGVAAEDLWHIQIPGTYHVIAGEILEDGSQVAPIVAESIWAKVNDVGLDVNIVIQNAGGVRRDIPMGDITLADVYEIVPFGNSIVVLDLTGADMKNALESGVEQSRIGFVGAFPYVAGLRYTAEMSKAFGERITLVEIQNSDGTWSPLDPSKIYRLATDSYLATGGNGYDIFEKATAYWYDTGFLVDEAFAEYVAKRGVLYRPAVSLITYIP